MRALFATIWPELWWVRLTLGVGLLHGLLYVVVIPPWQHYEEPAHMEFAWMILTRRSIPGYGTYDNTIRREIAQSMMAHGFFRDLNFTPNLNPESGPIWIGLGQADTAPLYHCLIALPLGLFAWADVTIRLYAARLMSLGMYLVTLWVAYQVVRECTPSDHPLRWGVPLTLALLPGFTDLMTAVNDDVGATLIFSLFLWATVRLVKRGNSLWRVTAVMLLALLCFWTKTTALLAVPLAPVAVVLSMSWGRLGRWILGGLIIAGSALALTMLGWGEAAAWYRETVQPTPLRISLPNAPLGQHVLGLTVTPGLSPVARDRQNVPREQVLALRGKTATLGAWLWATQPVRGAALGIMDGHNLVLPVMEIDQTPRFYVMQAVIPTDTIRVHIVLQPEFATLAAPVTVYYDGVTLAEGVWPQDSAPAFDDPLARRGEWGGQPFINLARNASMEEAWPWVRPWAESVFQRAAEAYLSPSVLLTSALDWPSTGWVYGATAQRLLETFWARFGWAHVALPARWYSILWVVTGAGVLGGIWQMGRALKRLEMTDRLALIWLTLVAIAIWGSVSLRGLFTVLEGSVVLPAARYAYPAIIPTWLCLMAGWRVWLRRPAWQAVAPIAGLLILDVVSILTILNFYHGR